LARVLRNKSVSIKEPFPHKILAKELEEAKQTLASKDKEIFFFYLNTVVVVASKIPI
jgi:hypothetical protein